MSRSRSNSSLRCIWIIRKPTASKVKSAKMIFSRTFPTSEKRAQLNGKSSYVAIIRDDQLVPLLLQEVGSVQNIAQFIPSRDRCDRPMEKPVHKLETENGILWPIVAIERNNLLFCCLCFVEKCADEITNTPLINIPSIPLGFALLGALADFLSVPSQELPARVSDLTAFTNEAAPFGIVRDASADNICARLANKPCVLPKSNKVPAWKSSSFKGKPTLQLHVSECIKSSQCAQETWEDVQEVYGSITCKAELEGSVSDVTMSITHSGDGLGIPLDQLIVHPCVQRSDWHDLEETNLDSQMAPRRLRFSPPTEMFTLCHYTARNLKELPIFGVYHMKPEDNKISITVQLKLNDQVRNNFEFCELHIPFQTRAPISHFEGTPTQGTIAITANKKVFVWNIGQKFTSKDQQVLLAASITFEGPEQGLPAPTVEDAFCRGNNSYAQLYFKIQDFTHTGCHVDPKSIQVSPNTKFKLTLSREYSSVDYKIWNSNGKGLTVPVLTNR